MRSLRPQSAHAYRRLWSWIPALVLLLPASALAQYDAPKLHPGAIGEKYRAEVSGTIWSPDVFGIIASEQFGIPGSQIDFSGDLGFETTKIKDIRFVLRPARKVRFRGQYTPVSYHSEAMLSRAIVFNGQKFPLNLPVHSEFDWNVLRLGLEYDFIYRSRGFVGVLFEGRYTEMSASLSTPLTSESTKVRAPLPAAGIVARAYVLPEVALNFEVSTFRVPSGIIPDIEANYFDWDVNGTINLTNNVGVQVGWRRMTNFLSVKTDLGETRFQGFWFGGALRY